MEIQRIQIEGARIDRVRNMHRMIVEVDAVPAGGVDVQGRRVIGTGRVEIYADRLDAVLAEVRTERHQVAYQAAKEAAERTTDEWKRENRKALSQFPTEEARAKYVALNCNVRPEQYLNLFGFRTGLPPLASCRVVHPVTEETVDAREWAKLPADKRSAWLIEPPATPETANAIAVNSIAAAIAAALGAQNEKNGNRR